MKDAYDTIPQGACNQDEEMRLTHILGWQTIGHDKEIYQAVLSYLQQKPALAN
jgi:hypothetical protein